MRLHLAIYFQLPREKYALKHCILATRARGARENSELIIFKIGSALDNAAHGDGSDHAARTIELVRIRKAGTQENLAVDRLVPKPMPAIQPTCWGQRVSPSRLPDSKSLQGESEG
jgi:hypothetical protein